MVAIVLTNDGLTREFPQTGVVVRASGDKIRGISTERTVPHPTLMRLQRGLQWKCTRGAFGGQIFSPFDVVWRIRVNRPNTSGVVGRTSSEVTDVRRKENTVDVGEVGLEARDWNQGRNIAVLDHTPNVDIALE